MMSTISTLKVLSCATTALLLLLSLSSRTVNASQYGLYKIKPFIVMFNSNTANDVDTSDDSLHLLGKDISSITSQYLKDTFNLYLLTATDDSSLYLDAVHSVDLETSVHITDGRSNSATTSTGSNDGSKNNKGSNGEDDNYRKKDRNLKTQFVGVDSVTEESTSFTIEVYGSVSFKEVQTTTNKPTLDDINKLLSQYMIDSFDMDAIPLYRQRLISKSSHPIIQNMMPSNFIIELNVNEKDLESVMTIPDDDEKEFVTNPDDERRWERREFLLCFVLGGFLLGAVTCLYIHMRNEHYQRIDKKWMKENNINNQGPYQEDDVDRWLHSTRSITPKNGSSIMMEDDGTGSPTSSSYIGNRPELNLSIQSSSDPTQNGTGGDPNIIPIAAENVGTATSRRYMTPASPFEIIYGAAFMHSDREAVERARQQSKLAKKMTSPSNSASRSPGRKNLAFVRPMLSISEEDNMMNNDSSHSYNSNGGGFASTVSPVSAQLKQMASSFYDKLSSRMMSSVPEYGEGHQSNIISPTSVLDVEKGVVFRDFPRHDGTPCLMYNPSEMDIHEAVIGGTNAGDVDDDEQISYIDDDEGDHSIHSTNSYSSYNTTGDAGTGGETDEVVVDNFVDNLESLMKMKVRQYEERKRMHKEREELKKLKRSQNRINRTMMNNNSSQKQQPTVASTVIQRTVSYDKDEINNNDNKNNNTTLTNLEETINAAESTLSIVGSSTTEIV